jgi:hypothetical protein
MFAQRRASTEMLRPFRMLVPFGRTGNSRKAEPVTAEYEGSADLISIARVLRQNEEEKRFFVRCLWQQP